MLSVGGFLAMLGVICPASAEDLAKEQVAIYGNPAGDIGSIDPQGGQFIPQDMFHRPNLFDGLVHYPEGDANSTKY